MQTYYGVHLTAETGDALFAEFGSLRVRFKIGRPDIHVSLMHVCNQVTIPDCDFTPVSMMSTLTVGPSYRPGQGTTWRLNLTAPS